MKKIGYIALIALVISACGQEKDKITQLKEYKKELKELKTKIAKLEQEIDAVDTTTVVNDKAVLVSALAVENAPFRHMIEVRGAVKSRRNILLSAEVPGTVEEIYVKEGQKVNKGQTLLILEADVLKNRIATLKTQLELAETVFERQKKLWEKNIGTEIQYLEAKNKKETLERELSTAYSQLSQAIVKAPFTGVVDEIPAKEGELMQPGMPLVRLINPDKMYIDADISEKFIGRFKAGDKVEIYFPSMEEMIKSEITSVSNVINDENRTFSIEVELPEVDFMVKPNQVTMLRLQDYQNEEAITIPTKIIQTDLQGQYVFTLEKEQGSFVAKKQPIATGMTYNSSTEIKEGLSVGDLVIDKGLNELNDGIEVRLADEKAAEAVRMAAGN